MAKTSKKKSAKKTPPKKDPPLKVDMTFEELLKLAATTPLHKKSKKK